MKWNFLVVASQLFAAVAARAEPDWYLVHRLGYSDADHTHPDTGRQSSQVIARAGRYLRGESTRYLASGTTGRTAWVFDLLNHRHTPLGIFDARHTAEDGNRWHTFLYSGNNLTSGFRLDPVTVVGSSRLYLGNDANGETLWGFDSRDASVTVMGLLDGEHTRENTGYQHSTAEFDTVSGFIVGSSERYAGSVYAGRSAWVFNPVGRATLRAGLFDPMHTSQVGIPIRDSRAVIANEAGQVVGHSTLYPTQGTLVGQSTWFFDPASGQTMRIGLFDAEHSDPTTGYAYSEVRRLFRDDLNQWINDRGQVVGISTRIIGGLFRGESAWVFDVANGTTLRLGLRDAEHTGLNGVQVSRPMFIDSSGLVVGLSMRYDGSGAPRDSTIWLHDLRTQSLRTLGYTDAEHTHPVTGARETTIQETVAGRLVSGRSARYYGNAGNGYTAWVLDLSSMTTTRLGLTDADHTRGPSGYRSSSIRWVFESGSAIGASSRSSLSENRGSTVWYYDAAESRIRTFGLLDAEHVSAQGAARSSITQIAQRTPQPRFFAGTSDRMSFPFPSGGNTAWVFDRQTGETTRVGWYDARHTNPAGGRSVNVEVFENGLAAGGSIRYGDWTEFSRSPWMHAPGANAAVPLVFSERADSFALTSPWATLANGDVFGSYIDCSTEPTRERLFSWSFTRGMVAVDERVLAAGDAAAFSSFERTNGVYFGDWPVMIGSGRLLADGRFGQFALIPTPVCPADVDDGSGGGRPDLGVTIDDLLYYVHLFATGNPRADVDDGTMSGTRDGGVTIDDVLYYLARYASGC